MTIILSEKSESRYFWIEILQMLHLKKYMKIFSDTLAFILRALIHFRITKWRYYCYSGGTSQGSNTCGMINPLISNEITWKQTVTEILPNLCKGPILMLVHEIWANFYNWTWAIKSRYGSPKESWLWSRYFNFEKQIPDQLWLKLRRPEKFLALFYTLFREKIWMTTS